MYPHTHFLFAFLLAEILVKFDILSHKLAVLVALIAVLIDIDHYIYYGVKHNSWDIRKAWNAATVTHEKGERTFIHHSIGFFIITALIIIGFYFNKTVFWILTIGYYSHIFLDYVNLNILRIKRSLRFKEEGFVVDIPVHEVVFDLLLIVGIALLLIL